MRHETLRTRAATLAGFAILGLGAAAHGATSNAEEPVCAGSPAAVTVDQAPAKPVNPVKSPETLKQEKEDQLVNKLVDKASENSPTSKPELKQNISTVMDALEKGGIQTPNVVAYTMATVEHETGNEFKPIKEYGGEEQAVTLHYRGGRWFYGRGYIQLTHNDNYLEEGKKLGMGDALVKNPDLALKPEIAAPVLVNFFKGRGVADLAEKGDFVAARGPVNGEDKADKIADEAKDYLKVINS